MNGDNDIRVVTSYHYPDPVAFDLAKIAPVTSIFSFHSNRITNYKFCVRFSQAALPQFVLRVSAELHPCLSAEELNVSPSSARNADAELAAVDLGGGAVALAVVGDGGGQDLGG